MHLWASHEQWRRIGYGQVECEHGVPTGRTPCDSTTFVANQLTQPPSLPGPRASTLASTDLQLLPAIRSVHVHGLHGEHMPLAATERWQRFDARKEYIIPRRHSQGRETWTSFEHVEFMTSSLAGSCSQHVALAHRVFALEATWFLDASPRLQQLFDVRDGSLKVLSEWPAASFSTRCLAMSKTVDTNPVIKFDSCIEALPFYVKGCRVLPRGYQALR